MKITNFTVGRRTNSDLVRATCIKHDYYTAGDTKAYEQLLSLADNNECDDELIQIMAEDIYRHSDVERIMGEYGCSKEDVAQSIIYNLLTEGSYVVVNDVKIKA